MSELTIFEPGTKVRVIATASDLIMHAVQFRKAGDEGEVVKMIKNRNNYVEVRFMHPVKRNTGETEVCDVCKGTQLITEIINGEPIDCRECNNGRIAKIIEELVEQRSKMPASFLEGV